MKGLFKGSFAKIVREIFPILTLRDGFYHWHITR